MLLKLVNNTSISRYQAPYGENVPRHLIQNSPAPIIFFVKLHHIPFNLCYQSGILARYISFVLLLFSYLYVCMCFFATTSLVNKDLYIKLKTEVTPN